MVQKVRNLIVGGGISGATLAHLIAERKREEVLVVDARAHIAGNCFDYKDENGIGVHRYGAHIFRTELKSVWDFLSSFTGWYPYQHRVLGLIDGWTVPIPFNLNSLYLLFPNFLAERIASRLIGRYGFGGNVSIMEMRQSDDPDIVFLADFVYEKVFFHYTKKQWGYAPEEMDASVTSRIPIRISRDDRYFTDRYQGIPDRGYTAMIRKMLDHPKIEVRLETPYEHIRNGIAADRLFYTGPIDEYFDYEFGELPYRSMKLELVEFDKPCFQEAAVVNYPGNYDFTRIIEHKYFLDDRSDKTVVSYEYPEEFRRDVNERDYPVPRAENTELYARYAEKASSLENVHFLGRLGDYKYYNMDESVRRAMELFDSVFTV